MKKRIMFVVGVGICMAVAILSIMLERVIPGELLGSSIIALFLGTIINSFFHPAWIKPALKFTSKRWLLYYLVHLCLSAQLCLLEK